MRVSTEGDMLATEAAHNREGAALGNYNFLLGPTAWRLSAGLGLEYTDNVHLSQNADGDFVLLPSLDAAMHWPLTLVNSVDFSIKAGYSEYLSHSDLSRLFIDPGSGLSFDVFVGDCKINFHERADIQQQSTLSPGVSGGGENLESLNNTAGLAATYDFGELLATMGYDHVNYIQLLNSTAPDTTSDNFTATLGVPVRPEITTGVEAGGSLIEYDYTSQPGTSQPVFNAGPGAVQWNAGVFARSQISTYINVRLDGGYTDYIPDAAPGAGSSASDPGFYFSGALSHEVNQWLKYTLTVGRSTDLSSAGQVQTRTFFQLTPSYSFLDRYALSTPVGYQVGSRPNYGISSATISYDQFTMGISLSRAFTRKLTASLSYQFVREDSGEANLDYTVNTVTLAFSYQF